MTLSDLYKTQVVQKKTMIKKTIMITSIAMIFLIGFTTNNANAADEEIIEGAIVLGGTDVFFWEFTGTDGTSDLEVKLECGNSVDPSTALDPFLTVIDPSDIKSQNGQE